MKKTQETLRTKDNTKTAVLYIAFELSHRKWKLAFSNGEKMRTVSIEARNLEQLQEEINKAKKRFGEPLQAVKCRVRSMVGGASGGTVASGAATMAAAKIKIKVPPTIMTFRIRAASCCSVRVGVAPFWEPFCSGPSGENCMRHFCS